MKYQNLDNLARFMASQPLKKFTQLLLVSVSLFSVLFSSSPFMTQYSLNLSFYFFPFRLICHAVDKCYVFLICNGILMVLAKTSGCMVHSRSGFDLNDLIQNQSDNEPIINVEPQEEEEEEIVIKQIIVEAKEEETENGIFSKESEEDVNSLALVEYKQEATNDRILDEEIKEEAGDIEAAYDQENEKECENDGLFMEEEEEGEEEVVEELSEEPLDRLSTEELNKKFEEFIRRMKEDIRIEARQQLVLVK